MRERAILLLMVLLLAGAAWAQPEGGAHAAEAEAGRMALWKTANFAILLALLVYLARKYGGPLFAARTAEIRRGIDEAMRLKKEAEGRYQEIETRLAQLAGEIERLRGQASQESAAEAERMRQETERALGKIQAQAEQEIAGAGKASRQELRAYAADLAVNLAAQRIRDRLTPDSEEALISTMVQDLESRAGQEAVRV